MFKTILRSVGTLSISIEFGYFYCNPMDCAWPNCYYLYTDSAPKGALMIFCNDFFTLDKLIFGKKPVKIRVLNVQKSA
ncbi:hypothetical protein [Chryseobacterium binzhouense]|uniref:hypothetical protein n=1 Tax=Chryseobacterium binzhouense TaxID=2593646 RepID=UPI00289A0CC1|nr:hypothetical protein [Chryseobacterium binzhouense]